MNVTINDAISALRLLRDHIKDNDYLWECYNLGVSALITIKDGNYQLKSMSVSRETLKEMAKFNCKELSCNDCKYATYDEDGYHRCMSLLARDILVNERNMQEVEAWINQNMTN